MWFLEVDFFMISLTFGMGIIVSVEMSIVIGAILNALILLKSWSRPRITIETRSVSKLLVSWGSSISWCTFQTEKGLEYLYVKPELGLFYPAADYVNECVKKAHSKIPFTPIVFDCSGVLQVDYSASKVSFQMLDFDKLMFHFRALRLSPIPTTKSR